MEIIVYCRGRSRVGYGVALQIVHEGKAAVAAALVAKRAFQRNVTGRKKKIKLAQSFRTEAVRIQITLSKMILSR